MNNKTTELDKVLSGIDDSTVDAGYDDIQCIESDYTPFDGLGDDGNGSLMVEGDTSIVDEEDIQTVEIVQKPLREVMKVFNGKNALISGYAKNGVVSGKTAKGIAYLVQDLFPLMAVVFLIATSNAGKTTLVLSLAMAIAGNLPTWAGKRIASRKRGVVYITCEGKEGIDMRIKGNSQHFCHVDGLENFFTIYIKHADFSNMKAGFDCLMEKISETIGDTEIALIIIDTLPGLIQGKENESDFATMTVEYLSMMADYFKATVMPLTHVSLSNEANANGARDVKGRGSSAFRGSTSCAFGLYQYPNTGIVELASTKMRDGRATDSFYFAFKEIAVELEPNEESAFPEETRHGTTAVLEHMNSNVAEDYLQKAGKAVADAVSEETVNRLYQAWKECDFRPSADQRKLPAITRKALRSVLQKEGLGNEKINDALRPYRASFLKTLLDKRVLIPCDKDSETYFVTEATAYRITVRWHEMLNATK